MAIVAGLNTESNRDCANPSLWPREHARAKHARFCEGIREQRKQAQTHELKLAKIDMMGTNIGPPMLDQPSSGSLVLIHPHWKRP
eukprot:3383998-Prymnesium_polylepis.2